MLSQKSLYPDCLYIWEAMQRRGAMRENTLSVALPLKVGSRPHTIANGHELFEVSEERDEEVAAFCHMLDM